MKLQVKCLDYLVMLCIFVSDFRLDKLKFEEHLVELALADVVRLKHTPQGLALEFDESPHQAKLHPLEKSKRTLDNHFLLLNDDFG